MTRWNNFYKIDPRTRSAQPTFCSELAAERFKMAGAREILDLACGMGRDTSVFAKKRFNATGTDLALTALEQAKMLSVRKKHSASFVRADARNLPFTDNSFDGVYCFGLLHEFTNKNARMDVDKIMKETMRVMRPKGILLLAVLAGNPDDGMPHVRLFNENMFDEAVKNFQHLDKRLCSDIGCTGNNDYRIWQGIYTKS
jgi:ubiquinone/menaquinone biosynthesis C-methylase UbiE